jgi:hypothetical protein
MSVLSRQASNRMLEPRPTLLTGAILNFPSDWRQGSSWLPRLRKLAAGMDGFRGRRAEVLRRHGRF